MWGWPQGRWCFRRWPPSFRSGPARPRPSRPGSVRTGRSTTTTGWAAGWTRPAGPTWRRRRTAWTSQLDGKLYGEPLVQDGLVVVATENNTVYALAANSGNVMWSTHIAAARAERHRSLRRHRPYRRDYIHPGHRPGPRRDLCGRRSGRRVDRRIPSPGRTGPVKRRHHAEPAGGSIRVPPALPVAASRAGPRCRPGDHRVRRQRRGLRDRAPTRITVGWWRSPSRAAPSGPSRWRPMAAILREPSGWAERPRSWMPPAISGWRRATVPSSRPTTPTTTATASWSSTQASSWSSLSPHRPGSRITRPTSTWARPRLR